MLAYLSKRLLLAVPVLIGITLLAFVALESLPGDLANKLAGKNQNPEVIAQIRDRWQLDEPVHIRYVAFLDQVVVQQDLGRNEFTGVLITEELAERFAGTVELALAAMLIAAFAGIRLGIIAGRRPDSATGAAALTVAYAGISIPIFWLAILAAGFFASVLHLLPAAGRIAPELAADLDIVTGFYVIDALLSGNVDLIASAFKHLILPAAVLATIPMAIIVRLTRASMIEELDRDYVRTARAKGVPEDRVVGRHAFQNALIPVITTTGAQIGYLLSGTVLTETVFGWNGLGTYIVRAVQETNTPALAGGLLLIGLVFVVVNLLTDLTYALIDPRVRAHT